MMDKLTTPSCCQIPPVVDEYQPKGRMEQIASFDCYTVGPADADKVVICVYDVFGFWASTKQGADLVHAATGARVVMPDFFRGSPLSPDVVPPDTPEKMAQLTGFMQTKGDAERVKWEILEVAKALKAQGAHKLALYGLCWGAKPGTLACFDNTPFLGLVQIHASLIVPEDAVHLTCPIASFTSRDEPAAVFEQYHDKVRANTAIASKSVFHNYENMHHGFAGARANLKDTKNVEAFQDVYKRTSAFLDIIFA